MKRVEQRISPAGFARLRETLLRAENEERGPDDCARAALASVGLWLKGPQETVFIVDYTLNGPVWPFMDWPDSPSTGGH
jgi:hypothetical protein